MPDILDEGGLQVKTLTELRNELVNEFKAAYGENINVDQNSPDGQTLNILAQAGADLREVLTQVNANFDPDQAKGRLLDQRVALNGIIRKGGTYTTTFIEITTNRALNLPGLDDQSSELNPTVANLYTVKDDAGTEFYLLDSAVIAAPGVNSLLFRAARIGKVEIQANTITSPVTIVAGVTNINNPSAAITIGVDEESEAQLKIRRSKSVALPSIGYLDGIEASLANLDGVSYARVYENDGESTDAAGIPPKSIWAVVEGGDAEEIGNVLKVKKSSGSGMRGDEVVNILRPNNSVFVARFDRPGVEDIYIRFTIVLIGGGFIDTNNLKEQIVNNHRWEIGQDAGADEVTSFLKSINKSYRITDSEISDDGVAWVETLSVTSPKNRFVNDVSRISIT